MSSENKKRAREKKDASIPERMEASAIRILANRSHTRAELRRKLHQRSFPKNQIEDLLDRLESIGYLNDAEAARNWAARRIRSRPMGRRSMEQELKRLGLSDSIIEDAVSRTYEDRTELEHARRAAEKRLKALGGKDKVRDRLLRFLQGRGFSVQICFQAAENVLNCRKQHEEENGGLPLETEYPTQVQKE